MAQRTLNDIKDLEIDIEGTQFKAIEKTTYLKEVNCEIIGNYAFRNGVLQPSIFVINGKAFEERRTRKPYLEISNGKESKYFRNGSYRILRNGNVLIPSWYAIEKRLHEWAYRNKLVSSCIEEVLNQLYEEWLINFEDDEKELNKEEEIRLMQDVEKQKALAKRKQPKEVNPYFWFGSINFTEVWDKLVEDRDEITTFRQIEYYPYYSSMFRKNFIVVLMLDNEYVKHDNHIATYEVNHIERKKVDNITDEEAANDTFQNWRKEDLISWLYEINKYKLEKKEYSNEQETNIDDCFIKLSSELNLELEADEEVYSKINDSVEMYEKFKSSDILKITLRRLRNISISNRIERYLQLRETSNKVRNQILNYV